MSIATALGISEEEFLRAKEKYKATIKEFEKALGRKYTDEEKEVKIVQAMDHERKSIGSISTLKKYGIEISENILKNYAVCKNCKWYATYEGVCCNSDSKKCADFTDEDFSCEKFESVRLEGR